MKNRAFAVLLVICLAALPVAGSAAPTAEAPTRSRWLDLLSDLVEHLVASGSGADEEEPPAAPPTGPPVAPQPTTDLQELSPEGGTDQAPDMDPIG